MLHLNCVVASAAGQEATLCLLRRLLKHARMSTVMRHGYEGIDDHLSLAPPLKEKNCHNFVLSCTSLVEQITTICPLIHRSMPTAIPSYHTMTNLNETPFTTEGRYMIDYADITLHLYVFIVSQFLPGRLRKQPSRSTGFPKTLHISSLIRGVTRRT